MRALYVLSDFLLYPIFYHLVRYRRRLVARQLADCFPERSARELKREERRFYHFLCDYMVETLALMTMSPQEMKRRVTFEGFEDVQHEMIRRGKTLAVAYLGHYGNWEWLASFSLWMVEGIGAAQVYHPLHSTRTDRFFLRLRARFGGESIPMRETMRRLLTMQDEGQRTAVGFIADQSPSWEAMHHWTRFLHHDTSFFVGAERIGRKTDALIIYVRVARPRRGYYRCRVETISWNPREEAEYAITNRYAQLLEQQIRQEPYLWLWTHNRWKRTKEEWERRQHTTPRSIPSEGGAADSVAPKGNLSSTNGRDCGLAS